MSSYKFLWHVLNSVLIIEDLNNGYKSVTIENILEKIFNMLKKDNINRLVNRVIYLNSTGGTEVSVDGNYEFVAFKLIDAHSLEEALGMIQGDIQ